MSNLALLFLSVASTVNAANLTCAHHTVDFIMLQGDATVLAIEDNIRADLALMNITVNRRMLAKDDFNAAMVSGDFNLAMSETWGPPYDPHSYAKSWSAPDEAYYSALRGLPEPNTHAVLNSKIDAVLKTEEEKLREDRWEEIFSILHTAATELPFSGKRIPAIVNKRLTGYENGLQQFDYPLHKLRIDSGSRNITVAPGGQTGLFVGVGRLDPHSYRPNEFFANNWVYEGLIEYGPEGQLLPSLATAWTVEDISGGNGQKYTFTLRQGVTFHDGGYWNCSVAKMNFDNVLAPPLTTGDYHGWYGLPEQINGWSCTGEYTFEVTTSDKYYPLLQELTYIRPLRMLSPYKFVGGSANNRLTQNSCPTGWGNITNNGVTVRCAGTTGIAGTGRWKYVRSEPNISHPQQVIFEYNSDHWDASSGSSVPQFIHLVKYADHTAVKMALLNNTLDVVVGDGVLAPADIEQFRTQRTASFNTYLTDPLQNRMVVFNTAKAPTNITKTRTIIIHAVNKAAIVESELGVLAKPVDNLFPRTAPYCDVDLTPKWDYDSEKAQLLNCPQESSTGGETEKEKETISTAAIAVIVVLAVVVFVILVFVCVMVKREKDGQPMFSPLMQKDADEGKSVATGVASTHL